MTRTTPETEKAAAVLAETAPSDDEVRGMLQFLCGYCPDGIEAAARHVAEMRRLMAEAREEK